MGCVNKVYDFYKSCEGEKELLDFLNNATPEEARELLAIMSEVNRHQGYSPIDEYRKIIEAVALYIEIPIFNESK